MCEQRYRRAVQRNGRSVSFHCAVRASASDATGKLLMCNAHAHPSDFTIGYWITHLRVQCPEWRTLSTWTPRRVATSFNAAWQAFFRRVRRGDAPGFPRYKSRRRHLSIPYRCLSGCSVKKSDRHQASWTVRLAGVPGDLWARRETPPTPINEWMDADINFKGTPYPECVACAAVSSRARRLAFCADHEPSTWMGRWELSVATAVAPRSPKADLARLAARIGRIRNKALHEWTQRIVARAAAIVIVAPPSIKELTRRGRPYGEPTRDEIAAVNRRVLSYAPASAVAMLRYKAAEAGIRCDVVDDQAPAAAAAMRSKAPPALAAKTETIAST
jgi:putative transposase